ncbi:MAG: hypothetical protein V3U92_13970 [Cellulophaga sp.]
MFLFIQKLFSGNNAKVSTKQMFSITKKPFPILEIKQITINGVTTVEVEELQTKNVNQL